MAAQQYARLTPGEEKAPGNYQPPSVAYPPQLLPPPYEAGSNAPPTPPTPDHPAAYSAQPPYVQNAVIITQPTSVIVAEFGEMPVSMTCTFCEAVIQTEITYEAGDKACVLSIVFCCIGGPICCWIPFVVDSFKDIHHICPNCNQIVGVLKR